MRLNLLTLPFTGIKCETVAGAPREIEYSQYTKKSPKELAPGYNCERV